MGDSYFVWDETVDLEGKLDLGSIDGLHRGSDFSRSECVQDPILESSTGWQLDKNLNGARVDEVFVNAQRLRRL